MKHKTYLIIGLVAALTLQTASALPRPKKSASPTATPAASASASASPAASAGSTRAIPFHGMISSVDSKAKTFTITGKEKSRTFKVTDKTAITKTGQTATMSDVVANEEARGSYLKGSDGSLEVKTLKVGALTEQEKAAQEARKERRAEKKAGASGSASPAASATPKP